MRIKLVAILTTVAALFFMLFLLFAPATYEIIVKNTIYYENCSSFNNSENKCTIIEPADRIVKREPFVKAWWQMTQIERTYPTSKVSTEWVNRGVAGFGQNTEVLVSAILALIQSFIVCGTIYLFIATLIKASRLKGTEKAIWICLIIFLFPLGSIIFIFTKLEKK